MANCTIYKALLFTTVWYLVINSACKKNTDEEPIRSELPPLEDPIPYSILEQGKLVFQRVGPVDNAYSGIFVVDIDQQNEWGLSGGDLDGPSVSPDGQKIVYTTTALTETAYDVYVMDVDGKNRQCVSDINGQEKNPRWTSDGTQILFVAFHFDSDIYGLYRQSLVPGPADRLLVIDFNGLDPPCDFYAQEDAYSVSPNGKIAISSNGIYTLNSDGSNFVQIIQQSDYHPLFSPSWSPDGNKLAVLAMNTDATGIHSVGVILYTQDGTNPDTLVTMTASGTTSWLGSNSYSLCWSPDGSQIAFTRPDGPDVGSHIYVIRTDKTGLTQVTFSAGVTDRSLSWSN